MRFLTFRRAGAAPAECGVLADQRIVPLAGAGFPDLLSVIQGGPEALRQAASAAAAAQETFDLAAVTIEAPLARPSKIICIGLNYRDHAIESNMEIPKVPTVFNKFTTSVLAPGKPILLPKKSTQPDYEAEFAVVIGRGGRHIPGAQWRDHVFGYTILNDVSARDYQLATTQWLMGKTFDTFAPMGPYVVTADEIADPHDLDISLTINGETLQSSNTKHLIFRIPDLIEYLSSVFTLEPGDIISTGTPAGVGFARKPPRYLKEGDDVVVKVAGLGELRNPVAMEP